MPPLPHARGGRVPPLPLWWRRHWLGLEPEPEPEPEPESPSRKMELEQESERSGRVTQNRGRSCPKFPTPHPWNSRYVKVLEPVTLILMQSQACRPNCHIKAISARYFQDFHSPHVLNLLRSHPAQIFFYGNGLRSLFMIRNLL